MFILAVFAAQGCTKKCGECFTPPDYFVFELVDKSTGENLFTNETFDPEQIEVINEVDGVPFEFNFIDENELNLIEIYSVGWTTETVNLQVSISGESIFNLYVEAESVSEDCCSFTRFHEIRIENCEYENDSNSRNYKILVD